MNVKVYARTAHTTVVDSFVIENEAALRRGMEVVMPEMVILSENFLDLWFPNDDSPAIIEYESPEDAALMAAQWEEAGVTVHRFLL